MRDYSYVYIYMYVCAYVQDKKEKGIKDILISLYIFHSVFIA